MYVDGTLVGAGDPTVRPGSLNNISALRIGRESSGPVVDNFYGDIDEVQFFKNALSQAQIQAIFNAGPSGLCTTRLPRRQSCTTGGGF